MKRSLFAIASLLLPCIAACDKTPEGDESGKSMVFSAVITPQTKTTLQTDSAGYATGKVFWESSDEIAVYDKAGKRAVYSVRSIDPDGTAQFVYKSGSSLGTGPYRASYGADSDSVQTYGTTGRMAMSAKSSTTSLEFSVSTGILEILLCKDGISVSRINVGGTDASSQAVSRSLVCPTPVGAGDTAVFHIVMPAGVYKSFEIVDSGSISGFVSLDSGISLSANSIRRIVLGESLFEPMSLSESGTANCYVVSASGRYSFDCTARGDGSDSIRLHPSSAEVLWESVGTTEAPQPGTVIKDVSLSEGRSVRFSTTGVNGNALVAVRDAQGEIIWSWHIWCCGGFNPSASAQSFYNDGGTFMDRNLGALSPVKGNALSLGLLYQWGRKDPFPGGAATSYSEYYGQQGAATSTSLPAAVKSDAETGTPAYADAHPTTFITGAGSAMDWLAAADYTRWPASKATKVYDPCPYGWRIPSRGNAVNWIAALGTSKGVNACAWGDFGIDFGSANGLGVGRQFGSSPTIWYPAAGMRDGATGELAHVGFWGRCYTRSTSGPYSYAMGINALGGAYPTYTSFRSTALSVRCEKDGNSLPEDTGRLESRNGAVEDFDELQAFEF